MAALTPGSLGIFDYSSGTVERRLMKLKKKQVLNVLYQFVIFGPIEKQR